MIGNLLIMIGNLLIIFGNQKFIFHITNLATGTTVTFPGNILFLYLPGEC